MPTTTALTRQPKEHWMGPNVYRFGQAKLFTFTHRAAVFYPHLGAVEQISRMRAAAILEWWRAQSREGGAR